MKKSLCVSMCFLILVLACNEKDKKSVCEQVSKEFGQALYNLNNKEETQKVIKQLNNIISNYKCLDAYLLRANMYYELGNRIESLNDYKMARDIDTNSIYILFKIGILYDLLEKYDSAVNYYSWAISKKVVSGYVINYNNSFQKDIVGKIIDVDYKVLKLRRGIAAYFLGNTGMALSDLSYCISNNYFLADSFFYRGTSYLLLKKYEKACSDLKASEVNHNAYARDLINKYCKE